MKLGRMDEKRTEGRKDIRSEASKEGSSCEGRKGKRKG